MRGLHISFILIILLSLFVDSYAVPRKQKVNSSKPALTWVKDNSRLFTADENRDLNATIRQFKDSVKTLPDIYVVTQNDYSLKSPFFIAIKSSVTDNKWYISEAKEFADDIVILIRPQSKLFATPQLNILCNRNSQSIVPFLSSPKIDRLQSEYNKYLNDTPNTAQSEVVKKLIGVFRSRFFDGSIRDYSNVISAKDEVEIVRFIQKFQSSITFKVAVVTTSKGEDEDSVFRRLLISKNEDTKSQQTETIVEYKNLHADIVFVFYPKGVVQVFSSLNKEKLSDKALQNLTSEFTSSQAKQGNYKQAMQTSLTALSDHLNGEKPLDGMSIWEKIGAALLGIGIPSVFGWLILKDSLKKKKARALSSHTSAVERNPVHHPRQNKPVAHRSSASKPEKKEENAHRKPIDHPTTDAPLKVLPPLKLTKPSESGEDRGWTLDNTGSLPVTMGRIDDLFKPISPRNEHEKVMLEMIDYMRSLREYTDQEIAHSSGSKGISCYLDELYGYVDPAAVRVVFNRGLDLLIKNYAERDARVRKYVK